MSQFPRRAVIVAPQSLADRSAGIAQALGPDAREDLSFGQEATQDGVRHVVCDTPLTEATYQAWLVLKTNPAQLAAYAAAGWVRKDIEPPPPTEAECADWLAACTIWLGDAQSQTGVSVESILTGLGFTFVPPPSNA